MSHFFKMEVLMEEKNNIVIYQLEDGKTKIDVKLEGETVWLSQQQMAELYDTTKQNVSLHIKNIFDEEELDEDSTVKEFLTVQQEGNRSVERKVKYYNLDMIISLGYRIKSKIATNFRKWSTLSCFSFYNSRWQNLYVTRNT